MQKRSTPRLRARAIMLAALLGLLALAPLAWWRDSFSAVHTWRARLAAVSDSQVAAELSLACQNDPQCVPVLVDSLYSAREPVSQAAANLLNERIELWGRQGNAQGGQRLADVASALAAQVDQAPAASLARAAELAERLLTRPAVDTMPRDGLLADCGQVLRTAARRSPAPRQASLAKSDRTAPYSAEAGPGVEPRLLDPADQAVAERALVPGGGLPLVAPVAKPTSGATDAAVPAASSSPDLQGPGNPVIRTAPRDAENAPGLFKPDPRGARPVPGEASSSNPLRNQGAAMAAGDATPLRVATAIVAEDKRFREDEDATLGWMQQLHDRDAAVARRAEEELRKRGFTAAHLEMARRMTDPNPLIRRQFAEALPGMEHVDAKVWLICLSRDEDADVRLAAVTVMATSGDPELVKRVEQIARQDRDPRIQKQGERLQGTKR